MKKTAIVLINVGTPDDSSVKSVRKYLREFLSDARVLNMPTLLRKFLVNCIIVPFRAPKSAKLYEKLWTKNGSPLLHYSLSLENKLHNIVGTKFKVVTAMNYQSPNIENVIKNLISEGFDDFKFVPMFPQYASSTTGSVIEKINKLFSEFNFFPSYEIIGQFYDNEYYINSISELISKHSVSDYDHILFTYHGLPLSQVNEIHENKSCDEFNCTKEINTKNQFCYHATCYATTKLIAQKLNLPQEKYTTSFQSRFAKKWLSPFTDEVIKNLTENGCKKLLVVSPAFTIDCLETIIEIGHEYKELFMQKGEKFTLVECLNDNDLWAQNLAKIIFKIN